MGSDILLDHSVSTLDPIASSSFSICSKFSPPLVLPSNKPTIPYLENTALPCHLLYLMSHTSHFTTKLLYQIVYSHSLPLLPLNLLLPLLPSLSPYSHTPFQNVHIHTHPPLMHKGRPFGKVRKRPGN